MEDDIFYAIGSGSTAKCISRRLGIDYDLLGVDLVRNKKLVKKELIYKKKWKKSSKKICRSQEAKCREMPPLKRLRKRARNTRWKQHLIIPKLGHKGFMQKVMQDEISAATFQRAVLSCLE